MVFMDYRNLSILSCYCEDNFWWWFLIESIFFENVIKAILIPYYNNRTNQK